MTSPAPGWYPDPHVPMQMRWWDGTAWTEDTYERTEPLGDLGHPPGRSWAGAAVAAAGGDAGRASAGPVTRQLQPDQVAVPVPGRAGPATDDGVPLAGWWWRVLARLVDGLVVVALATVASRPAMGELLGYVREQYDGALSAGVSGEFVWATPSDAVLRAAYVLSVAQLVIGVLYEIGFLMWRSATPGKLLVGLRVRRWADGGRLDLTTVAKRVLASQIASAAPQVGPVYQLVDCLWPLRDRRRQALHDKLARSCVVRPRR